MIFLDTNIFIRVLVKDGKATSKACFALLSSIEEGKMEAFTSDMAVAEIVWTLESFYKLSPSEILDILLPIISIKHLEIPSKKLFPKVFELYVSRNIDFIDAYHAVLMEQEGIVEVVSYDKDFDKISSLKRKEPR